MITKMSSAKPPPQNGDLSHRKDENESTGSEKKEPVKVLDGSKRDRESPLRSSRGVISWQNGLALASVCAAIYFGLQDRFQGNRDSYPGRSGGSVPPTPNGRSWAPKQEPLRKLEDIPKDNGGWRTPTDPIWQTYSINHCDIDKKSVNDLNPEQFEQEYRFKKPLLLSFPDGADGWTKTDLWTLKNLIKSYGKWEVGSGRGVDIVRHGGNGHYHSTFEEYVMRIMEERDEHKEPFYMFDRNFYNQSELPKSMHPPSYLAIHPVLDANIFFLGASMSGVSYHKHSDAWNGIVFGWKRWFFYPPTLTPPGGVWPGLNTMEWFDQVYPQLTSDKKPIECMQGPGEIMYIPESWYHGTINIGDTIAIGIQKIIGQRHMENLTYENNRIEDDPLLDPPTKLLKAFKIWEELHETYPTNAEIMNRLGENYAARGDYKNGIKYCLKAVETDPFFLVAHVNLGKLYFSSGDADNAEKHFLRAVEINPTNSDVCWIFGEFLIFRRRVPEAIKQFEQGARDHIDKKDFFENLVSQARQLLELDPQLKSVSNQKPKMMDHSFHDRK